MSKIFNALQRSEAEFADVQPSALTEAAEVLLRIEHRLATREESDSAAAECRAAVMPGTAMPDILAVNSSIRHHDPSPGKMAPSIADGDPLRHVRSVPFSISEASKLVALTDENPGAAEAFRLLAVRLREVRRDRALRKLLVTSTVPQEGKSVVAANLACTLAQGRQERVLLVEGDVRRPTLQQKFGIKGKSGICEWLRNEVSLLESLLYLADAGIWVLWSGKATGNPLDLLLPEKVSPLLDQLAEWFDWIIIDSPPLLPVADTTLWSTMAEGVLLVTRFGITKKKELLSGLGSVDSQKLVGAVVNFSKKLPHSDYYYSHAYDGHR